MSKLAQSTSIKVVTLGVCHTASSQQHLHTWTFSNMGLISAHAPGCQCVFTWVQCTEHSAFSTRKVIYGDDGRDGGEYLFPDCGCEIGFLCGTTNLVRKRQYTTHHLLDPSAEKTLDVRELRYGKFLRNQYSVQFSSSSKVVRVSSSRNDFLAAIANAIAAVYSLGSRFVLEFRTIRPAPRAVLTQ